VKLYGEASQIFKQAMFSIGLVDSKRDNTFNVLIFAGKVMAMAFWDSGEILLLEMLERGAATIDTENCWREVPPQSIQRIVGERCRHNRSTELLKRDAATNDKQNCWRELPPQSIQRIVGEGCRHKRYTELLERGEAIIDTQNCWREVPPQSINRIVEEGCHHKR
jgi:hypothetical protein